MFKHFNLSTWIANWYLQQNKVETWAKIIAKVFRSLSSASLVFSTSDGKQYKKWLRQMYYINEITFYYFWRLTKWSSLTLPNYWNRSALALNCLQRLVTILYCWVASSNAPGKLLISCSPTTFGIKLLLIRLPRVRVLLPISKLTAAFTCSSPALGEEGGCGKSLPVGGVHNPFNSCTSYRGFQPEQRVSPSWTKASGLLFRYHITTTRKQVNFPLFFIQLSLSL